jgi:EpsI family protein
MHGNSLNGLQESGWVRTESADVPLSIGKVRRANLRGRTGVLEMWSWYWINGQVVTSDYAAKAQLALDRMFGRNDDSAVVVITVRQDVAGASSEDIAESFVQAFWPAIQAQLDSLEGRR